MYARGILFGKMKYELGDHSFVRCPELGLMADIEFKTKGWMGGTYDAIGGFIKDTKTDQVLYELTGFWNKEMYIKDVLVSKQTPHFHFHTQALGLWTNKKTVNHKSYGSQLRMPSRPEIMTQLLEKNLELKISRGQ